MEPYRRRRREAASTPNILVQLGAAFAALWRLLTGGKRRTRFDSAALRTQFTAIEQLAAQDDGVHPAQAVLRADSVLDGIMRQVTSAGPTFADRLRALESRFPRDLYQVIWEAHKLRNQIAHEQPQVSSAAAKDAVSVFRRAASVLGAF